MKKFMFKLNIQNFANKEVDEEENEEIDEDDFDEEEEEEVEETEDVENEESKSKEEKKHQSREQNAQFAAMRREKEKKEKDKAIKDAYEKGKNDGQISALKKNPYTNEDIVDEYDLKVFNLQKQIEEDGGDPINDLPKRLAKMDREQASKVKNEEDEKIKRERAIQEDAADFIKNNPDLDIKEVQETINSKEFQEYLNDNDIKLGDRPLSKIYSAFKKYGKQNDGVKEEARKKSTLPPSSTKKQKETNYLDLTGKDYWDYERGKSKDYF